MLNFKSNLFFLKFIVLFFFILIFGYWGVDLNSEEVFIAFSFLFLVTVPFMAARAFFYRLFSGISQRRYSKQLFIRMVWAGHLEFRAKVLRALLSLYRRLAKITWLLRVMSFRLSAFKKGVLMTRHINSAKISLMIFIKLFVFEEILSSRKPFLRHRSLSAFNIKIRF